MSKVSTTSVESPDALSEYCSLFALLPGFEGYLMQKRDNASSALRGLLSSGGKWQKKYFVLQLGELLSYKSREDVASGARPTERIEAKDVVGARSADANDCSERKRHGCGVLLQTSSHGDRVLEVPSIAEAGALLRLLHRWLMLAPFFAEVSALDGAMSRPTPIGVSTRVERSDTLGGGASHVATGGGAAAAAAAGGGGGGGALNSTEKPLPDDLSAAVNINMPIGHFILGTLQTLVLFLCTPFSSPSRHRRRRRRRRRRAVRSSRRSHR
jgi:hypothetical protein